MHARPPRARGAALERGLRVASRCAACRVHEHGDGEEEDEGEALRVAEERVPQAQRVRHVELTAAGRRGARERESVRAWAVNKGSRGRDAQCAHRGERALATVCGPARTSWSAAAAEEEEGATPVPDGGSGAARKPRAHRVMSVVSHLNA